jgi:beta-lactamase class A
MEESRMVGQNRRAFLLALAATAASGTTLGATPADDRLKRAAERLAEIEARESCRLGVAVLDTGDGARLLHRGDERFPMCSTFKALAAAAVLKKVDEGRETLDRRIAFSAADLLEYAPVTKAHVADGGMALGDLCAAAIDWSDNTAGNLILNAIGGPAGWTVFIRSLGDETSRLDRNEPTLNTAVPGDPRDTTTPLAIALDLQKVLFGDVLTAPSRQQLQRWLKDDKVGDKRLRAGLPASWVVGDKTGSGDRGTANTIAFIEAPGRAPLIAAVFLTESDKSMDARNGVHKAIGQLIAETF